MKTKYILKDEEENVIAIFDSLADAEEMYLTLLEEDACECCNKYIGLEGFYKNLEEYYAPFHNYFAEGAWKTFEGMYLYKVNGGCFPIYNIKEVVYFED